MSGLDLFMTLAWLTLGLVAAVLGDSVVAGTAIVCAVVTARTAER